MSFFILYQVEACECCAVGILADEHLELAVFGNVLKLLVPISEHWLGNLEGNRLFLTGLKLNLFKALKLLNRTNARALNVS